MAPPQAAAEIRQLEEKAAVYREKLAKVERRRRWLETGVDEEQPHPDLRDGAVGFVPARAGHGPVTAAAAVTQPVQAHPAGVAPRFCYAQPDGLGTADVAWGAPLFRLNVNEELHLAPQGGVTGSGQVTYSVHPALPDGLTLDPNTGVISGVAEITSEPQTYRVTMHHVEFANIDLEINVEASRLYEASTALVDADFASRIEAVTSVTDIMPEPSKFAAFGDWMIWMVHRAWLNDPSLVELDFAGAFMPRGDVEPRIAPKLMAAMASNTYIEALYLNASNLQCSECFELANALSRNTTVRAVNLDSNCLDSTAVKAIAQAIQENPQTRIEYLSVAHQKQTKFFGRPTEEAIGNMMMANGTIVRLGMECADAHWRNIIDRSLLRNQESKRRQSRISEATATSDSIYGIIPETPIEARPLRQLELRTGPPHVGGGSVSTSAGHSEPESGDEAPSAAASSFPKHSVLHAYMARNLRVPTCDQLREFARNSGCAPLTYAAAAPLLRECCARLLEGAMSLQVVAVDSFGTETEGILRNWEDGGPSGGVWHIDVCSLDGKRCFFRTQVGKEPTMLFSAEWVHWLHGKAA